MRALFIIVCLVALFSNVAAYSEENPPESFRYRFPPEAYPENMSVEQLRAWLVAQVMNGLETPKSWEGIRENEYSRERRIGDFVPSGAAYYRAMKLLGEIPRPQPENDILVSELQSLISFAHSTNVEPLKDMLYKLRLRRICTTDPRVFSLLHDLILEEKLPPTGDNGQLAGIAIGCIGCIHIDKSISFLEDAMQPEYWLKQPYIASLEDEKKRVNAEYAMLLNVAHALEDLPLDTAIRLAEQMYGIWANNERLGSALRETLLWSLDRLWQIK